ncbi:hypothetical protein [Ralstonia solanacearum]|uniref:hypothetical protein n=1 Tax=Ralstonia solanacearum TaxID=305 RepID=UPI000B034F0E|nr:hypothetical protein [Ralstonia solanacearum]
MFDMVLMPGTLSEAAPEKRTGNGWRRLDPDIPPKSGVNSIHRHFRRFSKNLKSHSLCNIHARNSSQKDSRVTSDF